MWRRLWTPQRRIRQVPRPVEGTGNPATRRERGVHDVIRMIAELHQGVPEVDIPIQGVDIANDEQGLTTPREGHVGPLDGADKPQSTAGVVPVEVGFVVFRGRTDAAENNNFPFLPLETIDVGDCQGRHRQVSLRQDMIYEAALGIVEGENAQLRGQTALMEKVGHDVGDYAGFSGIMPRETGRPGRVPGDMKDGQGVSRDGEREFG